MQSTSTPKKAAKKAAKKSTGHDPKKLAKDTRRAYEHLGRVQTLLPLLGKEHLQHVGQLTTAGHTALQEGKAREAADAIRAAEHLCFGSLHLADEADRSVSNELETAIRDEMAHQQLKAEEHGGAKAVTPTLRDVYRLLDSYATEALSRQRYRAALEFARGAEALTHLEHLADAALPAGSQS